MNNISVLKDLMPATHNGTYKFIYSALIRRPSIIVFSLFTVRSLNWFPLPNPKWQLTEIYARKEFPSVSKTYRYRWDLYQGVRGLYQGGLIVIDETPATQVIPPLDYLQATMMPFLTIKGYCQNDNIQVIWGCHFE